MGGIQKLKHQTQNQQGFKSCPRVGGIPLHSLHHQASFQVSSRAPVWGASLFRQILVCQHKSFKSCPRVGGILRQLFKISHRQVSSRAPVWGASGDGVQYRRDHRSFKSCPRVGGIAFRPAPLRMPFGFKSCPRVGGIPNLKGAVQTMESFKSCPRVGGILLYGFFKLQSQVSSRAPVWGASRIHSQRAGSKISFKSCPRVGGIR